MIILCVVAVAGGGLWLRDYLARKRAYAERTVCVGSLIRIQGTKMAYAYQHGLTNGTVIADEIIWRENTVVEHCESGGRYSINTVGEDPSCSYTGVVRWSGRLWRHALP